MKPISSLPEAFACLKNLQAFLEGMMGTRRPCATVAPVRTGPKIKAVDRVLTLMRELNRPLAPREITKEWQARNWPPPKRGELYDLICGTLAHLLKKKRQIERTGRGFYSLPRNFPDTINPSKP